MLPLSAFWGGTAVDMLQGALAFWERIFTSIFSILIVSPEEFMGGTIWTLVDGILSTLQATGAVLLVIFFFYGVLKSSISFRDLLKQPTQIIGMFFRIGIAAFLVTNSKGLLLQILTVVQEIIMSIETVGSVSLGLAVPPELAAALDNASFGQGLGAFCAALIGTLVIHLLAIIVMVIVYGRFFKIYLLAAISPLPLSGLSSESTEYIGLNFLKSYIGECLRGVLILIACRIFSAYTIIEPTVDPTASVASMAWSYVALVAMNMLILVILVKSSDRVVKEIFGI